MRTKFVLFVLFSLLVLSVNSQTGDSVSYKLTARETSIGLGALSITDPYLSPISYSGTSFRTNYLARTFVSVTNTNLSYQVQFEGSLGLLSNPTGTASMLYAGTQVGWGLNYHFRFTDRFQLLVGGLVDGQFGVKWLSRNVNNPVNMDVAANLNAMAEARYDFNLWKRQLRLTFSMQSPVLGAMFVPLIGASYYEMFGLGNMQKAIHFSSLHNKVALNSHLNLQIPLRNSTIIIGVATDSRLYKANNQVYSHYASCVSLGFKADIFQFGGVRNVAPMNFLSTDR